MQKIIIGQHGKPGEGGAGGQGKQNPPDLVLHLPINGAPVEEFRHPTKIAFDAPSGRKGVDLIQSSPKYDGLVDLQYIVNNYKNRLRENLPQSSQQYQMKAFLDNIEKNERVQQFYDQNGLIHDFMLIDNQYLRLRKRIDFIPSIDALLRRTKEYRKQHYDMEKDNQTFMDIFYTAILLKRVDTKLSDNSVAVIDILGFLKTIRRQINKLNDIEHAIDWDSYQNEYKMSVDSKITMAIDIVEKTLKPEINKIFVELGGQIQLLLKEITEKQHASEAEKKALEEKRKKLRVSMIGHIIGSLFDMAATVLQVLGPVGAAAGTAIKAKTKSIFGSKTAEHYQNEPLNDLVTTLRDSVDRMKVMMREDLELFQMQLTDIDRELELEDGWATPIRQTVHELQEKTVKQIQSNEIISPDELKNSRDALTKTIEDNRPKRERSSSNGTWDTAMNIMKIGVGGYKLYSIIKKDRATIKEVTEAIAKAEENIKYWKNMRDRVHKQMIPMVNTLADTIKQISDGLNGQTHVELDVTKWEIHSMLRDVKVSFREMAAGTHMQAEMSATVDKLEELMAVMINIYDRIDTYKDHAEFTEYMTNLISGGKPKISDPSLISTVSHLKRNIQRNVIINRYLAAIHAIKQHQFPFAQIILSMFDVIKSEFDEVENLIRIATDKTDTLIEVLERSNVVVGELEEDRFSKIEFDSTTSTSSHSIPFFQWKYENISKEIAKFFRGEKITLMADIRNAPNRKISAVKFNMIEFSITSANKSMQKELELFMHQNRKAIRMSIVGNSYYRCDDNIYYISLDDVIVFEYSTEKDPKTGKPKRFNDIYRKIMESDYFLSPYTMWKIELIQDAIAPKSDETLKFLNSDLRIELTGVGQYIRTGGTTSKVCNDELAKYYHEG